MRLITGIAVLALAAALSGCGGRPYLTYPDRNHWFFPPDDTPLRSDLNLREMRCDRRPDGSLVVTARIQNQGSDIIATQELMSGDRGSFRVIAILTAADGSSETIESAMTRAMPVTFVTEVAIRGARMPSAQISGIDVVVDPDRVIPDPLRLNNRLQWQGRLDPAQPQCTVARR